MGTLVLALVLVSQVASILVFFSDVLLILLLAWLLAFILSPIVASLVIRAFPKLPRVAVVAAHLRRAVRGPVLIVLVVAGSLAISIGNFIDRAARVAGRLPDILAGIQGGAHRTLASRSTSSPPRRTSSPAWAIWATPWSSRSPTSPCSASASSATCC